MINQDYCPHHEAHSNRLTRSEKDIQDLFDLVEKGSDNIIKLTETITMNDRKSTEKDNELKVSIVRIVTIITMAGLGFSYIIQIYGGS